MAVNINRSVEDPFYRYKMPKLQSKIEGKGNGIKTVIPNMEDIAKSLSRPPEYTTKFFGFELGAQTIMDEKNSRFIVSGAHDSQKLAELLDIFIKKYVLCHHCGNPETDIVLKGNKKDKDIYLTCKACGKTHIADMSHKICNFIQKFAPPGSTSSTSKKEIKKEEKKTKAKKNDEANGEHEENGTNDEVVDAQNESKEEGDDVEGGEGEEKEKEKDPAEVFADYITSEIHTADELALEAKKLDLNDEQSSAVLIQVLLDHTNVSGQFNTHKKLIQEFVQTEKSKKGALGAIERLVGVTRPELLPKVSNILKLFYDNNILDEEDILGWAEKPTKKFVGDKELAKKIRVSAQTLIDWLKNAEEESDEE